MPDLDVDPITPIEVPETTRSRTIARAHAGEPLSASDMQVIFRIKKSRFHQLEKAGAFDRFKLQPAISNYCYSGIKVSQYLKGEHVLDPVFGRKRRG